MIGQMLEYINLEKLERGQLESEGINKQGKLILFDVAVVVKTSPN